MKGSEIAAKLGIPLSTKQMRRAMLEGLSHTTLKIPVSFCTQL
jgi:hypothetical protein